MLYWAPAAVDQYLPPAGPTAANPPIAVDAAQDGTDRQKDKRTDGRTPYRYLDPAAYCASNVNSRLYWVN